MDLEAIKASFIASLTGSVWWQRFKGSEFVTYLAAFISQMMQRAEFAAERRLQESFLTRSVQASSVLAHAESRGYIPVKRRPNIKQIILKNKTASAVQIPAMTPLYCPDVNRYYLIKSPVTIPALTEVLASAEQSQFKVITAELAVTQAYATVLLDPDTSDQLSDVLVYVQEPFSTSQLWNKTKLFRGTDKNSQAYVEFYTPEEQLGIRFGNGSSGKMPAGGSKVMLYCFLTDGATDVPADLPLTAPNWPELTQSVDISMGITLSVGTERESIESIRQNALYYPSYDEQLVWSGDHDFYIRTNIPGLNWISVWGEAEQEKIAGAFSVSFINRIYLSAHHPVLGGSVVQAQIMALYSKLDPFNEHYEWVYPVQVPFQIALTGKTITTNNIDAVIVSLKAALQPVTNAATGVIGDITPDTIFSLIKGTGLLNQFDIQVSGLDLMTKAQKNEFRYLDISGSIFTITH
jgi:hypothetical protein